MNLPAAPEIARPDVDKLAALLKQERDVLLARWRQQVRELPAAKHLDNPTLNDHLPALLDDLVAALQMQSGQTIAAAVKESTGPEHGRQRVDDAFDIVEVVAEYSILRGCIHNLAEERGLTLQGKAFHIVNRVL